MAQLLIAAFKTTEVELTRRLGLHHDLVYAGTVEEAYQLAKELQPDLIICSMLFDESRMFDLLRLCKSDSEIQDIPFICCQFALTQLPKAVLDGLSVATKAMGGVDFVMLVGCEEETLELVEVSVKSSPRRDANKLAN